MLCFVVDRCSLRGVVSPKKLEAVTPCRKTDWGEADGPGEYFMEIFGVPLGFMTFIRFHLLSYF